MDVSHILDPLNDAQRLAVASVPSHHLIVAGAGSGKTRVLVHRIAWLLATDQAMPSAIFAVTFTNKAAAQMRWRIEQMLGRPLGGMWVGTFHGMAHRMLRSHWQESGLAKGFQILDSEDQLRCIRRVLEEMNLDEVRWPPRQIQSYINARKDEGLRAKHLPPGADYWSEQMVRVYAAYQQVCDQESMVDFAELLLRCYELLRDQEPILERYQHCFKHLLIDEFQDTNTIQYAWIRLLTGEGSWLFAVGDDDQSIYGWRGARLENMLQFPKDFNDVTVVRLEQNYRSTGNILSASNQLIAHNHDRMGKNLWTDGATGDPIYLYSAINDLDEASFIIAQLQKWLADGGMLDQCAILYRVSSQSRVLEESLVGVRMPYRVHGGLRFYERVEIKSALAYLRLVANQDDNVAFERIVNFPVRGIGARTIDQLHNTAREHQVSMWGAAAIVVSQRLVIARSCTALVGFGKLIESLSARVQGLSLEDQVRAVLEDSQLLHHFKKDKSERAQARVENLEELITASRQFENNLEEASDPLTAYLSHAVLEAGADPAEAGQNGVNLMTLHAAKGLEFQVVFVCGLEEGLFPHSRSSNDAAKIEEERRLCYVGMTRAKQRLFLTYAEVRRLNRSDYYPSPSRFLRELPPELTETLLRGRSDRSESAANRMHSTKPTRPFAGSEPHAGPFHLGQHVAHPRFGHGVVLMCEGRGTHARVQVNFESVGSKWLVQSYANLSAV